MTTDSWFEESIEEIVDGYVDGFNSNHLNNDNLVDEICDEVNTIINTECIREIVQNMLDEIKSKQDHIIYIHNLHIRVQQLINTYLKVPKKMKRDLKYFGSMN